ncbi:MAG: hypothetical protein DI530_17560 [Sphingomonas sp.]|uniref:M23ase beta-sheet core domain-containing protein n=1 Tax=Variovorax paradoxus TaxID=34073 RepID=A0A2W5QKB2_VARPD|nr:M23 family metallopeptidase [Sphingomonas sp.]PZQ75295.1 MAG: hypothetical protein DI563_10055 [Variovorax paradoxus]PZU73308.1 MAG: hypothetical protein DI530_17560 [Sphingomonas sp.]
MSASVDLDSLLGEMRLLARYGSNATFRRAYSLVASYADASPPERIGVRCVDPDLPREPRPPGPFSFERVLHETQEDDLRRSVFLDPTEALVAALVEFYSGRLRVVEFRNPKRLNVLDLDAQAREFLIGRVAAVSVNLAAAKSLQEVVHTLRHIAANLENSISSAQQHVSSYKGDTMTVQAASCTFQRQEHMGSRYTDNGKKLEYHYRDVYTCMPEDACCSNQAYTEYRNDRWEVVWQDGNSQTPPPTPADQIPDFQNVAWSNRIPLYTDPAIGTQTSDYGWRRVRNNDGTYRMDYHPGIDVAAGANSNVQSNVIGRVVHINRTGTANEPQNRGVIILDANNVTHTYWHISPAATLQENDTVSVTDRLGATYDWGNRTHLHYAEHVPPNGDWRQRSDANSRDPLP